MSGKVSVQPVSPASSPDRKSTRLNSSHLGISYAVFCLKKKKEHRKHESAHRLVGVEDADRAFEDRHIDMQNVKSLSLHADQLGSRSGTRNGCIGRISDY